MNARLSFLAAAVAVLAPLAAQAQALSTEEILKKFKAPVAADDEDDGLAARAVRPDPVTRLCEPRPPAIGGGGSAGDNAFRNLVVVPAPRVDLTVEFDFGRATLRPEGAQQLDSLARALNDPAVANSAFMVAGHTDAVGSADANDRLSCDRALAAKNYLVQRGVAAQRLAAMGYGFTQPLLRNDPRAAANRRVEVKVLSPALTR
ncbi:MAG: OmpA family protein [Pseudomonadota bacterium]